MSKKDKIELGEVVIPGWLPGMADILIEEAEDRLGNVEGKARKEWVKDTLKAAARVHDAKGIPDWIENPAEDAIISIIVEAVFALKFRTRTKEERAIRRRERRAIRSVRKVKHAGTRLERKIAQAARKGLGKTAKRVGEKK